MLFEVRKTFFYAFFIQDCFSFMFSFIILSEMCPGHVFMNSALWMCMSVSAMYCMQVFCFVPPEKYSLL